MAVTNEQVTELYVAYFERAPDADGLAYWVNDSGLTIEQISASFFDQPETQAKYPETMGSAEYIETIYQNVFDRSADAAGAVYWASELDSGNIQRSEMVMAVVNGAIDTDTTKDATVLANKTAVGVDFAESGLNDVDQAIDVMSGVTAEADSVTEAKAKTDVYVEEASKYKLTTDIDDLAGTGMDDTFKGVISNVVDTATLTSGDKIDGGEGQDTLSLTGNGDASSIATTLTSIETVQLRDASVATTLDAEAWSGVEKYDIGNISTNTTIENAANTFNAIKLSGDTKGSTTTIELADGLANSTVAVELVAIGTKNTILDISDDSVENYKITSTSNLTGAGLTMASDKNLVSITVDGDSDLALDIEDTKADKLESINASALKAAISTAGNLKLSDNDIAVLGGSGNNVITLANGDNKITTLAGDDTISLGTGDNTIDAGDGKNTVTVTSGDNRITTGSGIDLITATLAGDNTVVSGEGDAYIKLGNGNNTITTGNGNNNLTSAGILGTKVGTDGIVTGSGNDTITTGSGNDLIDAGDGTNIINAGAGTNIVTGGSGDDTITTGSGNDTITTGGGSDIIDAGTGTNTLTVDTATTKVTLAGGTYSKIDVQANTDIDSSAISSDINVEISKASTVTLSAGDFGTVKNTENVAVTLDASKISSGLTYTGGSGIDKVTTGAGDDTINLGAGADIDVNGGAGNDTINGEAGADTIDGGAGNDTISGGADVDTMTGGAGTDTFVFVKGDAALTRTDAITDFVSGTDKISFTDITGGDVAIDGTTYTSASAMLTAANAALTSGSTDGMKYYFAQDGTDGYLYVNAVGTAATATDIIKLTGVTNFAITDVI